MGRDAYKDWVVIFSVTLIIAIVLIISGVLTYGRVDRQLSSELSATNDAKLPFEANALDKAIKVIDDHSANQKDIINANIPLAPL